MDLLVHGLFMAWEVSSLRCTRSSYATGAGVPEPATPRTSIGAGGPMGADRTKSGNECGQKETSRRGNSATDGDVSNISRLPHRMRAVTYFTTKLPPRFLEAPIHPDALTYKPDALRSAFRQVIAPLPPTSDKYHAVGRLKHVL